MARVGLRDDDYLGVQPIGFVPGFSSVPVALDGDQGQCALPPLSPGVTPGPGVDPTPSPSYPRATVRRRIPAGYSDDGNPRWEWQDQAVGLETIAMQVREEVDERAGRTVVTGTITVGYHHSRAPIMETAVVVMDDGTRWAVTKSTPGSTSTVLTVHRLDTER